MNNETFITDLNYLLDRWKDRGSGLDQVEESTAKLYYAITGSYMIIDLKSERSFLQHARTVMREAAPRLSYAQVKEVYEGFESDLKFRYKPGACGNLKLN